MRTLYLKIYLFTLPKNADLLLFRQTCNIYDCLEVDFHVFMYRGIINFNNKV